MQNDKEVLYLKLHPDLKARIRQAADEAGITQTQWAEIAMLKELGVEQDDRHLRVVRIARAARSIA
jgi:hypothetical protein